MTPEQFKAVALIRLKEQVYRFAEISKGLPDPARIAGIYWNSRSGLEKLVCDEWNVDETDILFWTETYLKNPDI